MKINGLEPATKYSATLEVKTSSGELTDATRINFVTPQILNPVTNLEVENVFETSARISWQKNGTGIDRYILIKDGPYGESKTVIMANNDNTKVSFISDCYNFSNN